MIDFASSLWSHRKDLIDSKERLLKLREAVNHPGDQDFADWFKLYALVLEYSPDLIIELGRAYGNSTCVFTEAINKIGKGKVVSIDYDGGKLWQNKTLSRLQKLIDVQWVDKLTIIHEDIMKIDFTEITSQGQRILLFWDAHGLEVAKYLIAHLFPLLQKKEHLIVVHDMIDTKHSPISPSYENYESLFWVNNLACDFEEIVPITNFITHNDIIFDTTGDSITRFLEENEQTSPDRSKELESIFKKLVGDSDELITSHMIYFDINSNCEP